MNRLSIIVPHLGENQPFEDTLVSVLQNRPPDCQVLVVHRGPYDDPYDLGDEVCFVEIASRAEILQAINTGIETADGEIIHLLQPGLLAEEGWTDAAVQRFDDSDVAAVAPLVLDANDPDLIAAAGTRFTYGGRRLVNGAGVRVSRAKRIVRRDIVGPTLSAAFFRRCVVQALDGLCPQVGESHADVDLALAMRRLGFSCVLEPHSVLLGPTIETTSDSAFRTGLSSERVFWRNLGKSGQLGAILAHTAVVVGSSIAKFYRLDTYTGLMGRLVAALDWSTSGKQDQRLQIAIQRCRESSGEAAKSDLDDEGPTSPNARPDVIRRMAA